MNEIVPSRCYDELLNQAVSFANKLNAAGFGKPVLPQGMCIALALFAAAHVENGLLEISERPELAACKLPFIQGFGQRLPNYTKLLRDLDRFADQVRGIGKEELPPEVLVINTTAYWLAWKIWEPSNRKLLTDASTWVRDFLVDASVACMRILEAHLKEQM